MKSKPAVNTSPELVVAIGSSAGGTQALKALFENSNSSPSVAFIVIQHLESDGSSLAVESLRSITKIPVEELQNGSPLSENRIYSVPSHTLVSFHEGAVQLEIAEGADRKLAVIDHLFTAVAAEFKEGSVGVILSGAASDGAMGIRDINVAGGLTVAQEPTTAEHRSMPDHAIGTGSVDHVLEPKEILNEIFSYSKYLNQVGSSNVRAALKDQITASLNEICEILLDRTKHDFKHYKSSTLLRRLQRRMQVLQLTSVNEYLGFLKKDEKEIDTLFNELLINVTSFFRDKEAFETLKSDVLLPIVQNSRPNNKIRIWSAGCSTGEEPYSIAMMLREVMSEIENPPEVQIIATDIDNAALEVARRGHYPATIAENITPERLERFFVKRNGRYHVCKEIREMCLFSIHNLITDPPFSQLDLIICRNVLIYLGAHLQKKLFPVFHYALRSGGYVFLGTSETLTSHRELFKPVSAKHRIAQRKKTALKLPSISTSVQNYLRHFQENEKVAETELNLIGQRIALDEMLLRYAIVTEEGQILSSSAGISKFIQFTEGAFQNNVVKLVSPSLRAALRTAFSTAKKEKRKVMNDSCTLKTDNDVERVLLIVQPMPQLGDLSELYWVAFQSLGVLRQSRVNSSSISREVTETVHDNVEQLERELAVVRQELDKSVQDLEASNEELKASNEELLSMNEELQSANEELETSKEEVQNSNDALLRANLDLENLLASTQIATLFLDDGLKIRGFTPAIRQVYNVEITDIGRKLSDFASLVSSMPKYPDPTQLSGNELIEDEVILPDGRVYLRRIVPYRNQEKTRDGIVVNFIDVTELRSSEGRFLNFANAVPIMTWMTDAEGHVDFFNSRWFEYTGQSPDEAEGWGWQSVLHPDDASQTLQAWKASVETGQEYKVEYRLRRKDGEYRWHAASGVAYRNEAGVISNWFGTCVDVHEQKEHFDLMQESGRNLRTIVEAVPQYIWRATPDGKTDYASERFCKFVGYPVDQILGMQWVDMVHPEDRSRVTAEWAKSLKNGAPVTVDFRISRGGQMKYHWVRSEGVPHTDSSGKIEHYYGTWTDIHERILAEEARKKSEQRFEVMANSAPVLVWIAGTDQSRSWFNKPWLDFTGTDIESSSGNGWTQFIHSEDLKNYLEIYQRGFATRTPFELEYRLKFNDDSYRWISARGVPLFTESGEFDGFIGACLDIHEHKRLSEAVKTSEAHFRTLVDKSPAVMWITNKAAECTYLSHQWYEITGRTPEQDLGFGWVENCHPDDKEAAGHAFFSAIEARGKISIRYRLRQRDGSYRWAVDSGLPLRSGDGEFLGYIGTVIDIDDQVRSEEKFDDLHERFNRSVEATDLGVWYCDLPFDDLIWNKEVKKHFFMSEDARVTIDMFYEHIHPEDRERTQAAIQHSIESRSSYDILYRTIDPEDATKLNWIRAIGWTDYDRTGTPIRFDGITLNVTAERYGQQELQRAKNDAEKAKHNAEVASEAKTRFLANMSHEIRTPLSAIVGFSDLLRSRMGDDADANGYIDRISRNSNQLSRLIDELLDLSKIEADKLEIEISAIDIDSVIEDVKSAMMLKANEKGVQLQFNWHTPKNARVFTDPVRLSQILINVVGNAVKFTELGTVTVDVSARAGKLIVRVADTGIGLSVQQQSRIFEPFIQADPSVTRKYGGTGLGLALAKRLSLLLGGDLLLEKSELGRGTTFLIEIATHVNDKFFQQGNVYDERDQIGPETLKGKTILVVDDSPDNRLIVKLFLTGIGASVVEAQNGLEGCDLTLKHHFDLVLMDIQMPIMDGYQAMQKLRSSEYKTPVVALTAHAFKEEKERCMNAGFSSYITKPIHRMSLLKSVCELIQTEILRAE